MLISVQAMTMLKGKVFFISIFGVLMSHAFAITFLNKTTLSQSRKKSLYQCVVQRQHGQQQSWQNQQHGCCPTPTNFRPSYQFLLNQYRRNMNRMNRDCDGIYNSGSRVNGMYTINVQNTDIRVYCEFQSAGYNWIVIQRRVNGNLTFYNTWGEYQGGFGDLNGNFWLGLNAMHVLTHSVRKPVLRVDLTDFAGNNAYAEYSTFQVESMRRNYRLRIGGYSGNAGDGLCYHNGAQFSTRDNDNDCNHFNLNCANVHMGGWWYRDCMTSNLNGIYRNTGMMRDGIVWYFWRQNFQPLQTVSMKIRACT